MAMITDLEYIKEVAEEREQENWNFRAFLKGHDMAPEELDAIVHGIAEEVSSQIDCTKCANCCKQIRPVFDEDDVTLFARGLDMRAPEFAGKYLSPADDDPSKYSIRELPCPFLDDDCCSNYDCRPKDCRSYPHLHKEDFASRLWDVVENYSICPIVFNVYERLKSELWRDDGFDEDEFGSDWT